MRNWNTLAELQDVIEEGYAKLGYKDDGDRGYRFLSSPERTLWSDRLIISINPAGNQPDYQNDSMFTADGVSAYVHERWLAAPMGSSKLQEQYQEVFSLLKWDPVEVLQAPLSPYRYRSWSKMPANMQQRTVEFCVSNIWKPYFARHCPAQIVCIGKPPAKALREAIPHNMIDQYTVPTGWNNPACKEATVYKFDNGTVMVQVPHLSRFGIMTADPCRDHLAEIFAPLLPQ